MELNEKNEGTEVKTSVVKPPRIGIVVNCLELNVRPAPIVGPEVVCVISALSEVTVDESRSTNGFYRVRTQSGAEGYCMKEYIAFKQ